MATATMLPAKPAIKLPLAIPSRVSALDTIAKRSSNLTDPAARNAAITTPASNGTNSAGANTLTAHADSGTEAQALKLGADDFLRKPFVIEELIDRMCGLLEIEPVAQTA